MSSRELTGRARTHIVELEGLRVALHNGVVEPFLALRAAAAQDGFDLVPASAFRDIGRQATIWNEKFRGERPLYDRTGTLRDRRDLSDHAVVDAILTWSALPGASRHHWGTDIDVVDRSALLDGQRFELVPSEFATGGSFERLGVWLDRRSRDFGFFRPYDRDRGGVAPEPWHLSYGPVSREASQQLTVDVVAEALKDVKLSGRSLVLARLPEIFERYISNIAEA